jgi:hypothetical protein
MQESKNGKLDDALDNEDKREKVGLNCAVKNVKPLIWALGVAFLVIVCFLIFSKNKPTSAQMAHTLDDPESVFGLLPRAPQSPQMRGQNTGWFNTGRFHACPNCGWRGSRLAIDAYGNHICPKCTFCPFQRNIPTGQGVAAVTSASPTHVVVEKLGMEIKDMQGGVMVCALYTNSWAQKGGIIHGDIIKKFNRKKVIWGGQFIDLVTTAPPEKRVPVTVIRMGKKKKLNVMVGEGEMEGVTVQAAPPAGNAAAWGGGRMGGFGLGPGGYIICSGCGFKMLHQRGVPAYSVRCPKCNGTMVREEILNNMPQGRGANFQRGQGQYPWCPQR